MFITNTFLKLTIIKSRIARQKIKKINKKDKKQNRSSYVLLEMNVQKNKSDGDQSFRHSDPALCIRYQMRIWIRICKFDF